MKKSKKYIHINKHQIKKNQKNNQRESVISCKTYNSNQYGNELIIFDENGKETAKVIYNPDKPLKCGAQVWIETNNDVEFIDE